MTEKSFVRYRWSGLLVAIIALGLASRQFDFLPHGCGDALWSMMVFCVWRIILPDRHLGVVALLALVTAFADEFSQLISTPWLDSFRQTFLGHMLLGQGFQASDLLSDLIGILVLYFLVVIAASVNRRHGRRRAA